MNLDALHDSDCPSIHGRALGRYDACTCQTPAAKIAVELESLSYALPSGSFDEIARFVNVLEALRQEAMRWLLEADEAILAAPHAWECNRNDAPTEFNFICSCWKGEYEARGETL